MQIQTIISKDGSVTVHVASLLYDLWEDYKFYRQEAEGVDIAAEPLRYKRLVRASVLAFFGYFEGALNTWVSRLDPNANLKKVWFIGKIEIVQEAIKNDQSAPCLNTGMAREIRNTILHVKPNDDDINIMENLLYGQFFGEADPVDKWLNAASRILKLERHPDVPEILKTYSNL